MAFGDRKLGMFTRGKFTTRAIFELLESSENDPNSPKLLPVQGIFDNAGFDAKTGQQELDTTDPRFTCVESEIAAVAQDMLVTINGARYFVANIKPDGTGFATVELALKTYGD